ncbi:UDP-GlcNAc:betaGal beta-1,3-N-acetylglucosaminyltransferase-like protein 1 [Musca vetustissima]|uniref:UDP-GlcNAc:betaGal beta-1,3-N-acetylglucosaminyltransferase-like protein 1 n=1 Tax=Musca vetustissima TaxID=27455 RepID=UPI002AB7EBEB|nr:UDP-GlcNAc:betaGal beta-1,3-N-acetylglucosaminyltransferase-like protein 1 [Musca vetustissima]
MPHITETKDTISIIITVLNGAKWVDGCMESIINQTAVRKCKTNTLGEAQTPDVSKTMTSPTTFVVTAKNNSNSDSTFAQLTKQQATSITTNESRQEHQRQSSESLLQIEICVFDDCSCDNTYDLLCSWQKTLREIYNIPMIILKNSTGLTKGVGYGRNRAIEASTGNYLCFQDIDDEMMPERISKQYTLAKLHTNAIIGSKFTRIPNNATCRFTKWANDLSAEKLMIQIYTSNGPTIIMPTWMCHRMVYNQIEGGFSEEGKGCPEDLIFFYKHLDNNGHIKRVDEYLVKYRYHNEATTFSVQEKTIRHIRLKHLLQNVMQRKPWSEGFSIWNAGKQGRRLFRELPMEQKRKVSAFCDVDKNKINKFYKYYDRLCRQQTFSIPIVHFSQVQPPIIICMKLDLTNGDFEANLQSLQLKEGKDYILFT